VDHVASELDFPRKTFPAHLIGAGFWTVITALYMRARVFIAKMPMFARQSPWRKLNKLPPRIRTSMKALDA